MKQRRIMVIDDEAIVCKMTKLVLEKDGYLVETFPSAKPALERLDEEHFDLVVTDLKMRDIDGMEVLRKVKSKCADTKVIMITAFASLDSAVEAIREKVDDFFAKPIKISELKARIKDLLEN